MTVAVCAAAGAVVLLLAPDGSLNKSVRTAVSLFMMTALLSPFVKNADFSEFFSIDSEQLEQVDMTEAVKQQMRQAVEEKITAILKECGIKPKEINIDISIDGENNLRIEGMSVTVMPADTESIITAENRIKAQTGADVKIEVDR